jgi:formylmethanofuran dehydrogenase subunit E
MEIKALKIDVDFAKFIERAADLHGHLGPFLVIGVRIGITAKRILNMNSLEQNKLLVTAKLPLLTPFSCIIDGIQSTTQCTVGNQKLKIENSQKQITVYLEFQNSHKPFRIDVNPEVIEELKNRYARGCSNEELAWIIASMPESRLFTIEKQ